MRGAISGEKTVVGRGHSDRISSWTKGAEQVIAAEVVENQMECKDKIGQ